MSFQPNTDEQATLPLSAIAFRRYLQQHELEPLDVALKADMRCLTVWKIWQGLPIKSQEEARVRQGLFRVTGESYTAPMLVQEEHEHWFG